MLSASRVCALLISPCRNANCPWRQSAVPIIPLIEGCRYQDSHCLGKPEAISRRFEARQTLLGEYTGTGILPLEVRNPCKTIEGKHSTPREWHRSCCDQEEIPISL